MSVQISEAFIQQYSANVLQQAQQQGSRLQACVRVERHHGLAVYYDRIGRTAAVKRASRHADTPRVDVPHSRRKVMLADYVWSDLIDEQDRLRMAGDPQANYVQAAAWAMGRAIDDEIVAAATGVAYAGDAGQIEVPFPAGSVVASASSGLTIAKLLEAKEKLDAAEVDSTEKRFVVCTARQMSNLLNAVEVKSADYNTVKALVQGELDSFLGFTFVRTQRLGLASEGVRRCLAFAQSGLLLSVGQEPVAKVTERPDKNYATQVYFSMSVGSTRMEEEKVLAIDCVE